MSRPLAAEALVEALGPRGPAASRLIADLEARAPAWARERLSPLYPDAGTRARLSYLALAARALAGRVGLDLDVPPRPAAVAGELARLVEGLSPPAGPPRDRLGPLQRALLSGAQRRDLGEFYTPEDLADHVAAACGVGPGEAVLDPACGAGAFLLAAARRGAARLVGVDRSPVAVWLTRTNLALSGLSGEVHEADAILGPPPLGRFRRVLGNPPWLRWARLPAAYREASLPLWRSWGLFSLRGHAARLGGGAKELASLFVYASAERHLEDGGRLAFVLPRSLFRTRAAGDGFRRFRVGEGTPLAVVSVDDLSDLDLFDGAAARAAVLVLERGRATTYPVPWTRWRRDGRRERLQARPVLPEVSTSPWVAGTLRELSRATRRVGASPYRARVGATTWANGVYWLRVLGRAGGPEGTGLLVVENVPEAGRRPLARVRATVEEELVYPLARGRDLRGGRVLPSQYILIVQDPRTGRGLPEEVMGGRYPHALAYLRRFEEELRSRPGLAKYHDPARAPWWSCYNIGLETFSPWKVVWREQARTLEAAPLSSAPVAGRRRVVVPDHKLMLVAVSSREEALYLAARLNAPGSRALAEACSERLSFSTHVLDHIAIPRFRRPGRGPAAPVPSAPPPPGRPPARGRPGPRRTGRGARWRW
ncbi:MAG: N-6 DNA methylase [Planctomycetes bacterium]|nr:N-6 DNA methylase [Planctomycetota bacterium]